MSNRVIAIEFRSHNVTSRMRDNNEARKRKWGERMHGRRNYACPACEGDGDASLLELCLPCDGTGIAASAPYWD